MKHRSDFLLVLCTSFFYFAAGFQISGEMIWDKQNENPYEEDAKNRTNGCWENMRLFGPDNQYRCNCRDLHDCDFGKNGKCKVHGCTFGFGGPFCQEIRYDLYLRNKIDENNLISFNYKYRINHIKMHCETLDPSETVTLHIGSKEFCNKKCSKDITCTGDEIGRNLTITIRGNNTTPSLSEIRLSGCSPFWFGIHCDKQCHCINNEECHKFTGKCPNGCEKGRSGPGCQKLNYENVALNKRASQSSTYAGDPILKNDTCEITDFEFSAGLAVDGNSDPQIQRRSCMHTKNGSPQWNVNLGIKYNISQIRIYHRNNNLKRFITAVIYVGGQKCYEIKEEKIIHDIKCDSVIAGENITISFKERYSPSKEDQHFIHVCEVEVLQCLPGFYGDRCSQNCSKCKNSLCEQWTGRCVSGCAAGYWQNDTKPCEACPTGMFGENCAKTCHCQNNTNCIKETGFCGPMGCENGKNCQGLNIYISIGIGLSALLVIISGIVICFVMKSKKKKDKTPMSPSKVSLPENIEMNFVEDNDSKREDLEPLEEQECLYMNSERVAPKTSFLQGKVKENDDEYQGPLEEQECLYMNSESVITNTQFLQGKVKESDEYQGPLEEQECLYMNSESVKPNTQFLQGKVKDYQEPFEEQEAIYLELI